MYVHRMHVWCLRIQKRARSFWQLSAAVGAGNGIRVLCKSSKYSELLSHFSSLTFLVFKMGLFLGVLNECQLSWCTFILSWSRLKHEGWLCILLFRAGKQILGISRLWGIPCLRQGLNCVAQAGLNSGSSCLNLPTIGIIGVYLWYFDSTVVGFSAVSQIKPN